MSDMTQTIEESFSQYAGAVLQSRALCDVRDLLKPSARQIFYCMETDKFTHDKQFKKTLKAIGSAMRVYIHGDSSCEGVIMRAGQPFAMRYPIVEVEGSYGNLMESGNWAAPRYTASRLSEISKYLFMDINKNTIDEWRDNYDDTEKYPTVFPSKGFYNLVNGCMGIGIGAASSCPQFNIKELNEALIYLLWNENATYEDICVMPDFATGGILLNADEVKDSLKNGTGFACKLRSVVEYDSKDRSFVVKEIPYGVYTNTICKELEDIINDDDNNVGIERFNDLTGSAPNIKIYLKKSANPNKVLSYLYKNTSLQYYYGINLTFLEDGRYPRVFGWKEMLKEHLNHELTVYHRGFEFDANKIRNRLHIIDGLLICMASIDEVVKTIKSSASTAAASIALQKNFLLDEAQAKAVLDMKLSRLAHLEVEKLEKEKVDLEKELARLEEILNSEYLLKKEVEKGLREVADKFGDARRTQILNLSSKDDEPVEKKAINISLTSKGNVYAVETSTLFTQKRGGVGAKVKLDKDEFVKLNISALTTDTILFFTDNGKVYSTSAATLSFEERVPVETLFNLTENEKIISAATLKNKKYIIFITKNGMVKKSSIEEYRLNKKIGVKALTLKDDDVVVSVLMANDEKLGMLTRNGNFLEIETSNINAIGRVAAGVKGIGLADGDYVAAAQLMEDKAKFIVSITENGMISKTNKKEFVVQGRGTKGKRLQRLQPNDKMIGFILVADEKEIIISTSKSLLKIEMNEVQPTSLGCVGVRATKLKDNMKVVGLAL